MRAPRSLPAGLAALLALCLPLGADAAKPKPAPTPAPAPAAAKPTADEKARAAAFADYEAQLATGQKSRAADALVALIDDPARSPFHAEAAAKLGDLLRELDLPYAALMAYVKAFELADDLSTPEVSTRVSYAMELADKVGDVAVLEAPFSKNMGLARTDDQRGEMAYLAARESMRRGSYGLALGILKMVTQADAIYPEAKVLEGIILNQQSRPDSALIAFEAAQKAGASKSQRFKDLLMLNVARTFYAAGNYPRAIQAFAAVPRASDLWPEAQFERAWAHFRLGDYNGTFGVLFSLDTPFFASWYFPEADLLRIYSLFYLCKFPEAEAMLKAFKEKYKPVHGQLQQWAAKTNQENFDAARRYRVDGTVPDGLPEAFLRPFATEDRFAASLAAVTSAEAELARLKNVEANPFAGRAKQWLDARRIALIEGEGARIKARVAQQESWLGQNLTNAEIFILDILRMKTILYEHAASVGAMPEAAKTAEREQRLRKNQVEWPFQGEIWADELGYYQVSTPPECPAVLRGELQQ